VPSTYSEKKRSVHCAHKQEVKETKARSNRFFIIYFDLIKIKVGQI